jgi:hypothetical protein
MTTLEEEEQVFAKLLLQSAARRNATPHLKK